MLVRAFRNSRTQLPTPPTLSSVKLTAVSNSAGHATDNLMTGWKYAQLGFSLMALVSIFSKSIFGLPFLAIGLYKACLEGVVFDNLWTLFVAALLIISPCPVDGIPRDNLFVPQGPEHGARWGAPAMCLLTSVCLTGHVMIY